MIASNQFEYIILRIPTIIYNEWREIAWNINDHFVAQKIISKKLQDWILKEYADYKLCAFDEITSKQAKAINREQGFYIKLRKMTPAELSLSADAKNGNSFEPDPQFILELSHIEELQKPTLPQC